MLEKHERQHIVIVVAVVVLKKLRFCDDLNHKFVHNFMFSDNKLLCDICNRN